MKDSHELSPHKTLLEVVLVRTKSFVDFVLHESHYAYLIFMGSMMNTVTRSPLLLFQVRKFMKHYDIRNGV